MRILIVGLGSVGQRHARNLRQLLGERLELLACRKCGGGRALTDDQKQDGDGRPEDRLDAAVFSDFEQALAAKPHGVIVSNPSSLHLSTARQAAEAGCALFIEKPLSHTWDGVPEFAADVARRGIVTMVGYQWRFHPVLARVRALLDQGAFGRLIAVNAAYGEYMPDWHPYEDYRDSYAARRELGGGVVLTQVHDIDYLGWLAGWPERVYSVGGHLSQLEMDVEDTSSSLWRSFADGREIPVHLHQDCLQKPPVRTSEFLFENGRIHCDLLGARLRACDAEGRCVIDQEFPTFRRNDMFLEEMRSFLACAEGRQSSGLPVEEGTRSLAVALAILRSQASGKSEPVTYLERTVPALSPSQGGRSVLENGHV
jgi:predicted dehydrogenase